MKTLLKPLLRITLLTGLASLILFWFYPNTVSILKLLIRESLMTKRSVNEILVDLGPAAKQRLLPWFEQAEVPYPPKNLALLGFKAEKRLEIWAKQEKAWQFIRSYPILAASGTLGPKQREGDLQVPEGLYRLSFLNPNSRFHLSMQINYPNQYDRRKAAEEQRTSLGGDIFIHGRAASVGCLAIGDTAIEELFVLVATMELEKVMVLLAPQKDMQSVHLKSPVPSWVESELYVDIREALADFR